MNAFYEHHQDSIRFGYRCFDRILLNGLIQPFQQPERVVGFFSTYRNHYPVSRDVLREISEQFHGWVKNRSEKWNAPILEAPKSRRDEFVAPYFRRAQPDQVVLILKAREPARILTAIGNRQDNRWHLQLAQRGVIHYNFYLNDRHWAECSFASVPTSPFLPASVSTSIIASPIAWGKRASTFSKPPMPSFLAVSPNGCKRWPIPSPPMICCYAAASG